MSHHIKFQFEDLPYSFDALEPHIDARTMEIHYTKHHRAYYDKFVAAIEGTELQEFDCMKDIFKNMSKYPAAVRNNGGGYYNHNLFWNMMSPDGGGKPSGELASRIEADFGSFENMTEKFSNTAATRFGSGWAWLIVNSENKLEVCSTPNQDNPLMDLSDCKGYPILGLDVWEHAYYLKYQNRRPDYIKAFWNVVNWDEVYKRFEKTAKK
ncbi:MAG: superoxide dismutase [Bacteroidales bacterium]|nr:superoxide dismutase [Bacteroidales bacterium]